MENILRETLSGGRELQDLLLEWNRSLPEEKFVEGLASDMQAIDVAPPDVQTLRRTFTLERILSTSGVPEIAAGDSFTSGVPGAILRIHPHMHDSQHPQQHPLHHPNQLLHQAVVRQLSGAAAASAAAAGSVGSEGSGEAAAAAVGAVRLGTQQAGGGSGGSGSGGGGGGGGRPIERFQDRTCTHLHLDRQTRAQPPVQPPPPPVRLIRTPIRKLKVTHAAAPPPPPPPPVPDCSAPHMAPVGGPFGGGPPERSWSQSLLDLAKVAAALDGRDLDDDGDGGGGGVAGGREEDQQPRQHLQRMQTEVDRLQRDNEGLNGQLEAVLARVDAVQRRNTAMKHMLLEACHAKGIPADMDLLNVSLQHHRAAPMEEAQAVHVAATVLGLNGGDVLATVQHLLGIALLRLPGGKGCGGGG
ncbi:hypothetical protein VOLCADRAFT_117993 [Volvox carteri f. nagariensis]|uniref:Uncharacterized protein n=1 Tax=Volvox carteri f. nagariensis TaxID=3068 RepID=D8TZQ4_VOLCA|nr:uncharacterized protein VOLCADRAFT_117993 [Volvox carteri f. nagariensis]EFJ47057.1 hypothetical protein VOLCADRAFT_117993 [Volvox carteri f. nagariensis]|eukprot:XP_002951952.1 hypothetical protein VOLCADRAFT_117993 [Volvox carteri f. nagariensis]